MNRQQREQQLREMWRTKEGRMRVLRLFWQLRGHEQLLQSGESVFDAILDHEFGAVNSSGTA